jgi:hypothetical protein
MISLSDGLRELELRLERASYRSTACCQCFAAEMGIPFVCGRFNMIVIRNMGRSFSRRCGERESSDPQPVSVAEP